MKHSKRGKSIPDQVFDILVESITTGEYQPGDRLPSENELCEMMGVSRPSVKTALDRLRVLGMVDALVGDGTYVKEYSPFVFLQNFTAMMFHEDDVQDILELRQAIELEGFRHAVNRADENDLTKVEQALLAFMEAYAEGDMEKAAASDFKYHLSICQCSRNKYLIMMFQMISTLVSEQINVSLKKYKEKFPSIDKTDGHWLLFEALCMRDFERGSAILDGMVKKNLPKNAPEYSNAL